AAAHRLVYHDPRSRALGRRLHRGLGSPGRHDRRRRQADQAADQLRADLSAPLRRPAPNSRRRRANRPKTAAAVPNAGISDAVSGRLGPMTDGVVTVTGFYLLRHEAFRRGPPALADRNFFDRVSAE